MFNVTNSSKMNSLKTIQEFSRTPKNIQGQHDVFQGSWTQQILTANSRTIVGAQRRLATISAIENGIKTFGNNVEAMQDLHRTHLGRSVGGGVSWSGSAPPNVLICQKFGQNLKRFRQRSCDNC